MKTLEELRGMTNEELANHVLTLQDDLETSKKDAMDWFQRWKKEKSKIDNLKKTFEGILLMVE